MRGGISGSPVSEDDAEISENTSNIYDAISLQLLDLMYVLHTKASTILANVDWQEFEESQRQEVKMRWNSVESVDKLPSTLTGMEIDFLLGFYSEIVSVERTVSTFLGVSHFFIDYNAPFYSDCLKNSQQRFYLLFFIVTNMSYCVKVKVKVKLRFSAPSAGIAEIEQT